MSELEIEPLHILFYVSQTNTFQGVLITNNTLSYYGFSYACGGIEWSTAAIIGYNSPNYNLNHPANGTPDIERMASCNHREMPAGRRRKRQSDGEGINGQLPTNDVLIEACLTYEQFDIILLGNILEITPLFDQFLPRCPPTKDLVQISTIFEPHADDTRDCHQSRMYYNPQLITAQTSYQFASVCCYDQANK